MNAFEDVKRVQLDIPLPSTLIETAQLYEHSAIRDVYGAARAEVLGSGLLDGLRPGSRVAVASGSRGVANIPVIVKAVVDAFRERGFDPFVIPAMGSHGGGTAEGQIEVLASLGVTEDAVGAPVRGYCHRPRRRRR